MTDRPGEVTALLAALGRGEAQAANELMPLLYEELRRIASNKMRKERPGHTLGTTALVHEAYLKLVGQREVEWQNRAHFLSVAAMAMRRILINWAEHKRAKKSGGDEIFVTLEPELVGTGQSPEELIALDVALKKLAELDERQARLVELRFFGGLTHEEAAEVLGVSAPTARRDWRFAKAWLSKTLKDEG